MRTRSAHVGSCLWTLLLLTLCAVAAPAQQKSVPQAGLGGIAQGETISTPRDDAGPGMGTEQRRAYDRGRKQGREDFRASLSRSYKRHDHEYDRRTELSFRRGYEEAYDDLSQSNDGMTPVQRLHYDDGFRRGRSDWSAGRSRNYKRYKWEYDSRSEKYFRRGYEDGFDRQPRNR